MSQLDAVNALGQLLHDQQLLKRFMENRESVIEELAITQDQSAFFLNLDGEQLKTQADSLVHKRRGEVAELIPNTWHRLGEKAIYSFNQYVAESKWPDGHRRHFLDASQFCEFLRLQASPSYLNSEHHWIKFLCHPKRISVRFVSDFIVRGKKRFAIQCCYRYRGRPRSKVFYLGVR